MSISIHSSELPGRVFRRLCKSFAIRTNILPDDQRDYYRYQNTYLNNFHSKDIEDAKLALLLKFACLMHLGIWVYVNLDTKYMDTRFADIRFADRPDDADHVYDMKKSLCANTSNSAYYGTYNMRKIKRAVLKLLECEPVSRELSAVIKYEKVSRAFRGMSTETELHVFVSVCRLCDSVVLCGGLDYAFRRHISEKHYDLADVDKDRPFSLGHALSDYVHDGKCIKCGAEYDIYSDIVHRDNFGDYSEYVAYKNSVDGSLDRYHQISGGGRFPHRTHRWRNTGSAYKDIVAAHIYECFNVDWIVKNIYPGLQKDAEGIIRHVQPESSSSSDSISSSDDEPVHRSTSSSSESTSSSTSESETESDSTLPTVA